RWPQPDRPRSRRRGTSRRSATAAARRGRSALRRFSGWCSPAVTCRSPRPSGGHGVAERDAEHLEALPLGGDGGLVEAEVRARRQRAPRVRREAVVGPPARLVLRLELLHVGVELDEARLLDDADIARDVAAHAVPRGPPPEPAA